MKLAPTSGNIALFLTLVVFLALVGPILSIWALNTLFPVLAIPYTIETWFAMAIIHLLLKSKVSTNK